MPPDLLRFASRAILLQAGVLVLLACHGPADEVRAGALVIHGAVAPAPITGTDAAMAAYFTVRNQGSDTDSLVGVASAIADRATLHEQMDHDGMAMMMPAAAAAIPAGGELALSPGGLHLMLEGLHRVPVAGDSVTLTLTFARAGVATVVARVVAYADLQAALDAAAGPRP